MFSKRVLIGVGLVSFLLISCGTTTKVPKQEKNFEREEETSSKEEVQEARFLLIPQNDKTYAQAYSWRTEREEIAMVSLKNSDIYSLRYTNVELYIFQVVEKVKKESVDDFQKVKMLHDIVALTVRYDAQGFLTGNIPSQDYASVLKRGAAVCEGFSNTIKKFCDELGISCRVVHGYARGVGTKVGNENSVFQSNHAWNIVKINGKEYQLDCTWDEGYLNGSTAVHEYKTTWLFAQPETFIYTHFPNYSSDQLLENAVTYQQFLKLPSLKPNFFNAVTDIEDFALVNECNGNFSLKAKIKDGQNLSVSISEDSSSDFLKNISFTEISDDGATLRFSFPKATRYKISFFQKDTKMEKSVFCGDFLIDSLEASSVSFPLIYSNYGLEKDGILVSPVEGPLVRGESYTFKIQTKYNEAALVMDKQWVYLQSEGNGIFSTQATIPTDVQKVSLSVKNDSGRYWSIVGFGVK